MSREVALQERLEELRAENDWLRLQLKEAGLTPVEPVRLREEDVDQFLEKSFAAIDRIKQKQQRPRVSVENTD